MKLISMTDFVLEHPATTDYEWQLSKHLKYANFLKQPLTLGMFVPTDEDGNVLEEPEKLKERLKIFHPNHSVPYNGINTTLGYYITEYQQAKERVLFWGFDIKVSNITNNLQNDFLIISETNEIIGHENKDQWFFNPYKKVEDLINYDLTLTETAIKQIGL